MAGGLASGLTDGSDDTLARVVHDLHGPLTVIRGLCVTLARSEAVPERRRALGLIEGEILRIADGLGRLSRSTGAGRGPGARVDLAALATAAAERFAVLAADGGIRLAARGVHSPAWITGDAAMLERVVDNLVRNALRHCAPRGCVEIALSARGGRVVLRVRDDGAGVPVADRDRIFTAGERGRPPRGDGRGLGLSIAREIAEAHGGRLTLDPVGDGACFRLSLPAARLTESGPRAA